MKRDIDIKDYIDTKLQPIQKDISRITSDVSSLLSSQSHYVCRGEWDEKHQDLINKIDSLAKVVYVGMGIFITAQVLLTTFAPLIRQAIQAK